MVSIIYMENEGTGLSNFILNLRFYIELINRFLYFRLNRILKGGVLFNDEVCIKLPTYLDLFSIFNENYYKNHRLVILHVLTN